VGATGTWQDSVPFKGRGGEWTGRVGDFGTGEKKEKVKRSQTHRHERYVYASEC
jgi:hypothetical protein